MGTSQRQYTEDQQAPPIGAGRQQSAGPIEVPSLDRSIPIESAWIPQASSDSGHERLRSLLIDFGLSLVTCWLGLLLISAPSAEAWNLVAKVLAVIPSAVFYSGIIVLCCQAMGMYDTVAPIEDRLGTTFLSLTFAFVIITTFEMRLTDDRAEVVRTAVTIFTLNAAALVSARLVRAKLAERRAAMGENVRRVLIIGAGALGRGAEAWLKRNSQWGYQVRGFLDDRAAGPRVLGKIADLQRVVQSEFIDEILIAQAGDVALIEGILSTAQQNHITARVVPSFYQNLPLTCAIEYLGNVPILTLHREPIPAMALSLKRIVDLIFGTATLIATAPIFVAVALAVRLDSAGPILYRSTRVGKKGKPFCFYKFRTMVQGAEALKCSLLHRNEREGPLFKIADDPRLTRVGRFLRKYSLDELPQLFNVLKGEMSLVGPRPPLVEEYNRYSLEHLRRLAVTPGITGLWQITARKNPSFAQALFLDLQYIESWTPWLDLKILTKTLPAVLRGEGQ